MDAVSSLARDGYVRLGVDKEGDVTVSVTEKGWRFIKSSALTNPACLFSAVEIVALRPTETWKEAFTNLLALMVTILFSKPEKFREIRRVIAEEFKDFELRG